MTGQTVRTRRSLHWGAALDGSAGRGGVSLIEMMVVISISGVVIGIAMLFIHQLLTADREQGRVLQAIAAVSRLSRVFREDVHAADRAVLDESRPIHLSLETNSGRRMLYTFDEHLVTRVESGEGEGLRQEQFYFPVDTRLQVTREDRPPLMRVSIAIPPGGRSTEPAGSSPRRITEIEAVLSRDARYERSGS